MKQIDASLSQPIFGIGALKRVIDLNREGNVDDRDEAALRLNAAIAELL